MQTQFKNFPQILEYYNDNEKCKALLAQQLWGDGEPVCPHCKHVGAYTTNRGYRCKDKGCQKKFTVITGTICENTKIELRYWLAAIYLITTHRKGISSHQLGRDLGISQKSAWFVLHRVREMLKDKAPDLLEGEVQVDETWVGGDTANKHEYKIERNENGHAISKKQPVMGAKDASRKVRAKKVSSVQAKELKAFILDNVAKGATMVTDEAPGYKGIVKHGYTHESVNHKLGEYVNAGKFTINGIENFWSLFKRGIIGIYHHIDVKHLDRYIDEFAYRQNNRKVEDVDRLFEALTKAEGRLKWDDLTAKEPEMPDYFQFRPGVC
jgi:transposase-like protein